MYFFLYLFIHSFHLSTCFEHQVLFIRRSNCINTSSGMISLCKWLLGVLVRHTKQSLTQTNHTRWCINTIRSPDDKHLMLETRREMKWINKYMKSASGWLLTKICDEMHGQQNIKFYLIIPVNICQCKRRDVTEEWNHHHHHDHDHSDYFIICTLFRLVSEYKKPSTSSLWAMGKDERND